MQMTHPHIGDGHGAFPRPGLDRAASDGIGPRRAGRLLVVDDDAGLLDAVTDALRDAGFEVASYTDPAAALAALAGGGFDVLLSDLMMPGMTGTELLRRARQIAPDVAGVIMTGQGSAEAEAEAAGAGALEFVRKPFRLRQVLPVLDRALAARRAGRAYGS